MKDPEKTADLITVLILSFVPAIAAALIAAVVLPRLVVVGIFLLVWWVVFFWLAWAAEEGK